MALVKSLLDFVLFSVIIIKLSNNKGLKEVRNMAIFNVIVITIAALTLVYALVSAIRNTEAAKKGNAKNSLNKDT